jgi:hypothetical protein
VANYCFVRRVARAFSILAALAVLGAAATRPAVAQTSANDCLRFSFEEGEKALLYQAQNDCERPLDCRMSYVVSCEDGKGRVTSSSPLRFAFALSKHGKRELILSARQCKQGWTIADVNWTCR